METENRLMDTTLKSNPITMKVAPLPNWVKESINILRGNLQLSAYKLKIICVTSAVKHEGKSSVAFHLARSFSSFTKKLTDLGSMDG